MSAGAPVVDHDPSHLAPQFREAVEGSLGVCHQAGLDAVLYEGLRSQELQDLYWRRGRPPTPEYPHPVTYAKSVLYSWHGYALAVDVISKSRGWFHPLAIVSTEPVDLAAEVARARIEGERWFGLVAGIFKRFGCKWGGDWAAPHGDPPHMQWGLCRATPSPRARQLHAQGGLPAVWEAVRAA